VGADHRVSERREVYRAKFSAGDEDSEDVYAAELDEATGQTLKVGALSGEVKQVSWSRSGHPSRGMPAVNGGAELKASPSRGTATRPFCTDSRRICEY
jgi:hypothetical protein